MSRFFGSNYNGLMRGGVVRRPGGGASGVIFQGSNFRGTAGAVSDPTWHSFGDTSVAYTALAGFGRSLGTAGTQADSGTGLDARLMGGVTSSGGLAWRRDCVNGTVSVRLAMGQTSGTVLQELSVWDGAPPSTEIFRWVSGTAYTSNQFVWNSSGQIYRCVTGGTAGATMPTGSGASISDGGCTWARQDGLNGQTNWDVRRLFVINGVSVPANSVVDANGTVMTMANWPTSNTDRSVTVTQGYVSYVIGKTGTLRHESLGYVPATVTLSALTLNASSYTENAVAGQQVATISNRTNGGFMQLIMGSGHANKLAFNAAGTALIIGSATTDFESSPTVTGTLRETHPGSGTFRDTAFSFNITDVQASITGTPPPAVVGQPYSFTFNVTGTPAFLALNAPTALDSTAVSALAARNITYDGATHTLSSANVT